MGLLSRAAGITTAEPLVLENDTFPETPAELLEELEEEPIPEAPAELLEELDTKTNEVTPETTADIAALEEKIAQFHQTNADFHCILCDVPASAGEDEKKGFCNKLAEMINKTGSVIPLPSNRPLILLPITMDRELIAHRLSRSLNTKPLLSFEVNSPENVINKINSFL